MVFGDFRMVSGEVASKLDSRGPFQAGLYSDSESNLPKVEVAGSIPVSRSSFQYETAHSRRQFCAVMTADWECNSYLNRRPKIPFRVQLCRNRLLGARRRVLRRSGLFSSLTTGKLCWLARRRKGNDVRVGLSLISKSRNGRLL
jgi:hypothetical protein